MKGQKNLSRRERQIMDIIFRLGRATAVDVVENLPLSPLPLTQPLLVVGAARHQPQHLAGGDLEGEVVQHRHQPAHHPEADREALDLEDRLSHGRHAPSRRPSRAGPRPAG